MYLLDRNNGVKLSLQDIKRAWSIVSSIDPENHANVFPRELYIILLDSVNGRNDFSVVGFTDEELYTFIRSLRKKF